jgi:cell division septation protein DedD
LSYAKRLQSDVAPKEQLKPRNEPTPAPAPAASALPQIAPPPAAPVASRAPASVRPGEWVVQVHALKDRAAAGVIARRLTGKGYPAFVLDPAAGAPVIYRVQVGRYSDRHEAEQVARRLEKEEQFKPWVQH